MSNFKLLIVEDDLNEVENNYKTTIARIMREKNMPMDCEYASSLEEALSKLNGSFDAAIVDLKLDNSDEEKGNDVIRKVHSSYRIPLAVLTGTPQEVDSDLNACVQVFTRDQGMDAALEYLLGIYSTGLTKIMGGRGKIEEAMGKIFWDNIIPHINSWVDHAKVAETENGLLRHVVSHIQELLEGESHAFPQEMYVSPPMATELRTGSILKYKDGNGFSIVLSPPCDLVLRADGKCKTDRILICGIEKFDVVKESALVGITNLSKKKSRIEKVLKNNETDYYHWLPETSFFQGGVVNFRWVNAFPKEKIDSEFDAPSAQVASPFIKDLLARFSAYYARQGQPDFDVKKIAEELA